MPIRRPRINVELDEATLAKLEWVSGRQGQSSHAFAKALLLAALAKHDDPPPGFGRGLDHEDD
jgi:hypothetical protein